MAQDTTQIEEQILALIDMIYRAQSIPDSHKQRYVDYIQENGITEKMVNELIPIFEKEIEGIEGNIEADKAALDRIEKILDAEKEQVDEKQATILANLEDFQERNLESMKTDYEKLDKEFDEFEEHIAEESEDSEEEAIRQKLGLK